MAKILMVQPQIYPYIGTAYLNGAAKSAGHELVVHLGDKVSRILDAIKKEQPDLIGFSCMASFQKSILEICAALKVKCNVPIILGGPQPTLFPDMINDPSVDLICRGEAESTLIALLDAIESHNSYSHIRGLWVKHGDKIHKNELRPLATMDSIPIIDWTCYAGTVVENNSPQVFPIRGCPYSCSYCYNESVRKLFQGNGQYVRQFSVPRAILELKAALKFFKPNPVYFCSDTFGVDIDWMEDLFVEYSKSTNLPFMVLLRPELANKKVISILARHRCAAVALGVESGSERVRKEILNRHYSNNLLLQVAENLHEARIKFRTYNMLGLPTETEAEVWETIDINIKMKTDIPRAVIFTPFSQTKIVETSKKLGFLDASFDCTSVPGSSVQGSILKNVDRRLILSSLYFFQTAVLFPKWKRYIKFFMRLPPNLLFKFWFYCVYAWSIYVYFYRKVTVANLLSFARIAFANRNSQI